MGQDIREHARKKRAEFHVVKEKAADQPSSD